MTNYYRLVSITVLSFIFFSACSLKSRHLGEGDKIDTNKNHPLILVNKQYGLPKNYVPINLVPFQSNSNRSILMRSDAAKALEQLFLESSKENIHFVAISGSYTEQEDVYNRSISLNGREHTKKYVAVPGFSEHQTGLAIDVSQQNQTGLKNSFEKTKEGKWLAKNAYRFGFIIRYPKGKEEITGYAFEPSRSKEALALTIRLLNNIFV